VPFKREVYRSALREFSEKNYSLQLKKYDADTRAC
jgi:hypothetical protein